MHWSTQSSRAMNIDAELPACRFFIGLLFDSKGISLLDHLRVVLPRDLKQSINVKYWYSVHPVRLEVVSVSTSWKKAGQIDRIWIDMCNVVGLLYTLVQTSGNMSDEKINPFDSFSEVYKVLMWAGFFKLLNKPKNRFKWICHQLYRCFAFMVIVGHNVLHIIFIIQRRDNWDDVFDVSMIELPQLNLTMKYLALNLNESRVDKINQMLNDPIFAAYTTKDEEMLLETTKNMHRCVKFIKISITVAGIIMWPASLFVKRYQDPTAIVAVYTPFATDTWTGFIFSVLLEVAAPMLWTGYGHLSLDCLVATYYAQAEVQLKIIKYNLEHLFDTDGASRGYCVDRDVVDKDLRSRFVHYVQRYEAVAWYTKEVSEVFNSSMSFEFFSSSATICVVTYRMSFIPILSVPSAFMIIMLLILLAQVLMYCYFGNLVQYESDSVVTAIYLSDWLSASPEFRRLMLIAMLRWSQRITPRVSSIVPLSLTTFVSVLKSAYSLLAVLSTK